MTFAWPHLFWLLLVPAALFAADLSRRRRAASNAHPKILRAQAGPQGLSLVRKAAPPHRTRPWLCVGLALAVVALTRPQWGRIEEPVFDQAREILIAIDLSRSMLAEDVKPSRLDRAKLLIQSLLEKLAGERVGLVSFSGTAFVQSPLSSDYEILREFLPALNPDFLPEGGTNYRALIDTSLAAFGTSAAADRFLVILSDGEATDDDWKSQVAELKTKGIRVIGLGIGTPGGAMIPDSSGGFVKDERGAVVLSKLESRTLEQLAEETNGVYRDASTWLDLAALVNSTVDAGRKGKFVEKNTIRQVERFQWPLAFAVWCLVVSFCYEFPVRPRPRDLKLNVKAPTPAPKSARATAGALALALVGFLFPARPLPAAAAATKPAAPIPLAKIVGRLSSQENRSARDWAELARETVTWGRKVQSESRPVPPGPVQDALAAVELGRAQDAKTADWPKLKSELEELLTPPEPKKEPPKQDRQKPPDQQNQPDQKNQQNQQQKDTNSNSNPSPKDQSKSEPQPDKSGGEDQSEQKPSSSPEQNQPKPESEKKGQSAFGNMNERQQPPAPPRDVQKVGGTPEKNSADQPPTDPQLALPLQKLDQVRSQDSPAQLFQLMDADQKPAPKKKGKDW